MKILAVEYNEQGERAVVPIGDNALLRNNDDFYVPEFAEELSCSPQLMVRIHKLGKCVEERFGERYYEEVGVGIRFYADEMERRLKAMSLPAGMASSFDGSVAISELLPKEQCVNPHFTFLVNGEKIFEGGIENLPCSLEKLIAESSNFYTLKIGDYLYCGNQFRYRGLKVGDRLQVIFQGKMLMNFKLQ